MALTLFLSIAYNLNKHAQRFNIVSYRFASPCWSKPKLLTFAMSTYVAIMYVSIPKIQLYKVLALYLYMVNKVEWSSHQCGLLSLSKIRLLFLPLASSSLSIPVTIFVTRKLFYLPRLETQTKESNIIYVQVRQWLEGIYTIDLIVVSRLSTN